MQKKTLYIFFGLATLLFLRGVVPAIFSPIPEINLYSLQAQAFLEGRWDIGQEFHDAAVFQNRYYVVFPPFPALVLTPFVWLFGVAHTNVVLISLLLTTLSGRVLFQLLRNLEVDIDTTLWVMAGFFMGTAYWMAVKGSFGVWHFAHVVSVAALFLALDEALSTGRGWLVGIYLGSAFLSRHMTIYALPLLGCILWTNTRRASNLFGLACAIISCTAIYLMINWFRFDNPFEFGYGYIQQSGFLKERLDNHGLFSVDYLAFNFIYLFLQGFHIQFEGDTLLKIQCLDPFGTSLTFSSPFLMTAFWAKWKRRFLVCAWSSIGLMVLHALFYFSNGYYQINAQRFSLDFLPILIILTALGAQQCTPKIWKPLVVYSIVLNLIASAICSHAS